MSYRDDLEAAHARIAALEAELAAAADAVADASGDADSWQRAKLADEVKQLRAIVEERRETIAELRAERDRLADWVEALEVERTARLLPPGGVWPGLWDHNLGYPALADGTPANVACPRCRAAGVESQMVRDGGVGIAPAPALDVVNVLCPRCLFAGLQRTR